MASFVQAYNEIKLPAEQKIQDMELVVKSCQVIASRWQSSERANEAYMILGSMYRQQKKPLQAATWFEKVDPSTPNYLDAQVSAGQAYWSAYLNAFRLAPSERPGADVLAAWLKSARNDLRCGIDKQSALIPKSGAPPQELIAAKLSLAQIMISQGQDSDGLKLLLNEPFSVMTAVTVADESKRPDAGVASPRFALEVHKLLLRAYLGLGRRSEAKETLEKLNAIIGVDADNPGSTFKELLKDLETHFAEELNRRQENGELERFAELKRSLEQLRKDLGGEGQ